MAPWLCEEEAPAALTSECAGKGSAYNGQPANFATHELTGDVSAAQAQAACGRETVCVVAAGATLRMETNLDVAALVVRGAIMWDDASQTADDQWLCAGYVATEAGGHDDGYTTRRGERDSAQSAGPSFGHMRARLQSGSG